MPEAQKYTKPGWYVTPEEGGFPRYFACYHGQRVARPGDVVYARRIFKDDPSDRIMFLLHKRCMEEIMMEAPPTEYERIRHRLQQGEEMFA